MAQETSLRVGVDSRPAEQGARRARGALKGIRSEARKTETSFNKLRGSLGGLGSLFAGVGVGLVVREFGQLLDSATNIDNRLKLVTNTAGEVNAVFSELVKISNDTRTGLESNADLFNRLALSTKELGLTFREQLDLTRSLNQALVISGASAAEGGAGLIQLAQGLASGAVRGDELRSVLENLPKVADVIAKGFGVTRGELRELGEQGKISAKEVVDAFRKAAPELELEFAKITPTIAASFTVLNNKALEFTRSLNKGAGVGKFFAQAILGLAGNFNLLATAAAGVAVIISGVLLKALAGLSIALLTNPFGLLIAAAGAAAVALGVFGESTVEVAGMTVTGWQAIEASVVTAWGVIKPIFALWQEAFVVIGASLSTFAAKFNTDLGGVASFFKGWASLIVGIATAIPQTIIAVFEDIPSGLEAVFKRAVNNFLDFRRGVLDIIGIIPGAIARIFGQDELAKALDETAGKLGSVLDVPRLKLTEGAQATSDRLTQIWGGLRTDLLDNAFEKFTDNLGKVVAADKAAAAATDLLNGKFAEGSKIVKESKDIIKARAKLSKQIQSDFDKIREATGRATEVTQEWADKTRAELKRLGLEHTKFADKFEEILLNRMQAARLKDVENSQAWAEGLTQAQRKVAGAIVSEFEEVRSARGENVDMLNEWFALEMEKLKVLGLANSEFADKLEEIYKKRLPEARQEDIDSATDAVGGIRQAMAGYVEAVGTAADQTKRLFSGAFQEAEDALVKFAKTGELSFGSLVQFMIDELIRLGIQQALTAAIGGIGGGAGGAGGGGGGIGGIVTSLVSGLFKEGGVSGQPTQTSLVPASAFVNAPHFAAGGVTGGIPSVLHDDEAVVPLSRGREIPVKMQGQESRGDNIVNYNIQTPDADSFRRSQDQIAAKASRGLTRANRRNN